MIKKIEKKTEKIGLKKIIKKNQVVIFTLALMLMTAGYMNYTNNYQNENTLLAQLGDAQLVSTNIAQVNENSEQISKEETQEEENKLEQTNITNEVKDNNEESIKDNIVETSAEVQNDINNINENEVAETSSKNNQVDDYFTKSKLERDSMYSQMLSTYKGILENEKIPSDQKGIAENEIKNISDTKNAIMIVENLLQSKEFKNVVVFINSPSVNVVVKGEKLEAEQVAKIQNIIQRELKTEIENIHISTKK